MIRYRIIALLFLYSCYSLVSYCASPYLDYANETIRINDKIFNALSGQIYLTEFAANSDLIVFISENEIDADLFVYINSESEANYNGFFITSIASNADEIVFLSKNIEDADLIVYITDNIYNIGLNLH